MRPSPEDLADIEGAERRFVEEATTMNLQFRCAACAHEVQSDGSCSLRFPNAMLRGPLRLFDGNPPAFVFCKSFELGEGHFRQ